MFYLGDPKIIHAHQPEGNDKNGYDTEKIVFICTMIKFRI